MVVSIYTRRAELYNTYCDFTIEVTRGYPDQAPQEDIVTYDFASDIELITFWQHFK